MKVGIADYAVVTDRAVLSTSGLGSCVALVLFDDTAGVSGLLHAMLPSADVPCSAPAKYVDAGVELVLGELVDAGADAANITAKMAGGSTMLDLTMTDGSIGDRNVHTARERLQTGEIPIVGEDVGGGYGRSVRFDAATAELRVKTAYKGECVI